VCGAVENTVGGKGGQGRTTGAQLYSGVGVQHPAAGAGGNGGDFIHRVGHFDRG